MGVIGPTRMDYDRALRTVSCLSSLISLKLEEIDGWA
jgi:transcriptional regulator of heat shock response